MSIFIFTSFFTSPGSAESASGANHITPEYHSGHSMGISNSESGDHTIASGLLSESAYSPDVASGIITTSDIKPPEGEFLIGVADIFTEVYGGEDGAGLDTGKSSEVNASLESRSAPWNIDRLDSYSTLDGVFSVKETGVGSTIYIMDSGVMGEHTEFSGRVEEGYSYYSENRGDEDCNGHGTHVAGIAAGESVGVANGAAIVPVKVIGCEGYGTSTSVTAGLAWIEQDSLTREGAIIINMSIGGRNAGYEFEQVVARLLNRGVGIVASSGNNASNKCEHVITSNPEVVVASAVKKHERYFAAANFGSCVDILAPGYNVDSSANSGTEDYQDMSGTSMASPHVSGAAAIIGERFGVSGKEALDILMSYAIKRKVAGLPEGTTNNLLYIPQQLQGLKVLNPSIISDYLAEGTVYTKSEESVAASDAIQTEEEISGISLSFLQSETILESLEEKSAKNLNKSLNKSSERTAQVLVQFPVLNLSTEDISHKITIKSGGKVIYKSASDSYAEFSEYLDFPVGKAYSVAWEEVNRKTGERITEETGFILLDDGFYITPKFDTHIFKVGFRKLDSKIKVYVYNIPIGSKVQILVLDKSNYWEEIALQRPDLRLAEKGENKLIRAIDLKKGMKSVIVKIDGETYDRVNLGK